MWRMQGKVRALSQPEKVAAQPDKLETVLLDPLSRRPVAGMKPPIWICPFFALLLISAGSSRAAERPEPIVALIDQHCAGCHDSFASEGDLDLTSLEFDLDEPDNFRRWQRVFDRVRAGEMPPEGEPRPAADSVGPFLKSLEENLTEADAARTAGRGRVALRRLTRFEYERTLTDLLGVAIPLRQRLPEDPQMDGFDTVSRAQQVSSHLLAKYLDAADVALDAAFDRAIDPQPEHHVHLDWNDLRRGEKLRSRRAEGRPEHEDVVAWSTRLPFYGRAPPTEVSESGWYRVRLRVAAVNPPDNGRVWCSVRSGVCFARASTLYWVGSFAATPEPREHEFTAWIEEGHMLEIRPHDHTLKRVRGNDINGPSGVLGPKGIAGVAIKWIDMRRVHPGGDAETVRENLFGGFDPGEPLTLDEIASLVRRFCTRAFRRPVSAEEAAPYVDLARAELEKGADSIAALRGAYRGVLCSPRFLYFDEAPGRLDDHALATRLSYFLWRTAPDEELLRLAANGELGRPKTLRSQTERMLNDPKADALVKDFADQWLTLEEIDATTPDEKLYPEFDEVLKQSMLAETRAFLSHLIADDLSVTHLVDSDFGVMNARLARHYGVRWPGGEGLQQVSFGPEDHRGGVLTHASVLKVTANGTSTSPVIRGTWVLERIVGEHVPPPPANVPAVEPDIRGATTIREQLAKHRSLESCAVCHVKIDPPGFALESYDVIGQWREHYRVADGRQWKRGPKVDPSYATADGRTFQDIEAFKSILLESPEKIARNMARHLVTYATGAGISFADRDPLDAIVAASAEHDYGLRTMIHEVVQSQLFTHK